MAFVVSHAKQAKRELVLSLQVGHMLVLVATVGGATLVERVL
jgi:hypothetical protein